jgi:heptosyltransferase-1
VYRRKACLPFVPRILFVKTSSLGDVIHHCPAVSDATRNLPGVEIDWLVEETFAPIARMHPGVRRAIPVAVRRWRRSLAERAAWTEIRALRRTLQAQAYDAVIDTQGLLKSALLAALARGPSHGMDRSSAREPFASLFYAHRHAVAPEQHAVERNRQLTAAALGYAADGPCDYGLRAASVQPVAIEGPYAALLTMTSRAGKRWPDAHWVRVGREISARGLRCVLPWGSEEERVRCESIARGMPNAIVPRHLSLEELSALLARSRAVIGVDTGLTHLAAALGVPTVGVYCASDPRRTGLHAPSRAQNIGAVGETPEPERVLAALAALS